MPPPKHSTKPIHHATNTLFNDSSPLHPVGAGGTNPTQPRRLHLPRAGGGPSLLGQLRRDAPGHFHAGIDIKTDGVEGKPLVAVADGYVSRIVVQAGGYGRAIYLTLRNGQTAVYGHLQRFRPDIEQRMQRERYARKSNSVDRWFSAEEFPVKQGDLIGYSGNSGSSGSAPALRVARHEGSAPA